MTNFLRSHSCGDLRQEHIGQKVVLCGWVNKTRDLGNLIFIDLRDKFGITQIILDPVKTEKAYKQAQELKLEWVICIKGQVARRQDPNPNMKTGQIEIVADSIEVLSKAQIAPFQIAEEQCEINEELRLKYRYLDMRKGKILDNLQLRHKAVLEVRKFLDSEQFVEVVTPILGKSTPEGARDYLVPSRIHQGNFYALPQSPQMFKQLLMIGGLDRYFQIALCFRDEDLRAERQPEFSQIDIEMSFATEDVLFPIIEKLMCHTFEKTIGALIQIPFKRMTHAKCMELYGTDKPDLRFGCAFHRLEDLAKKSEFQIFHTILANGGIIKGFCVKNGAKLSRKDIDQYTTFCSQLGAQGLVWLKRNEGKLSSSIAKYIQEQDHDLWFERLGMQEGDCSFIIAGAYKKTNQVLDHLRRKIAKDLNLIPENTYEFLWVTDFPLFTWNEDEKRLESEHHPFTHPHRDDLHLLTQDPLKVRSASYDLVLNGYEIASGSQRIHNGDLQAKIFEILGLTQDEIKEKFGFFVEALTFGTPPHIGIALGLDRITMILSNTENIRDVIAFPKTLKAQDLMMDAPSQVSKMQLDELKLAVLSTAKNEIR